MKYEDIPKAEHGLAKEPHVKAEALIAGDRSGLAIPTLVWKRWGHEIIYKNDEDYCMKLIKIHKGHNTSMHFHVKKHETLLVVEGELLLKYKDKTGQDHQIRIPKDSAWVVSPGFQHQLCAEIGDVVLIEASTQDFPDDSVRVRM